VGGYGTADTRVRSICSEARTAGIDIYTIAFQAPASSETLLRDCAGNQDGKYFDVDNLDIATAFNAIAINLTKLRLTQ
jgi:Mg-chelatase subunit ChlD